VDFRRSRRGTAADRGKLLSWPGGTAPSAPPARGFLGHLVHLGPGFVTGAADVDPSLVVTATVAGAAFGYSLLWVVLLCVPFLVAVFSVSGRLGYQTRRGLVDLLRENYGKAVAIACAAVIVAINLAMIVADLMAVSDALAIILGVPRTFFVAAVAFTVWYILIFRDYRRFLRALIWLSLPLFIYVAAAVVTAPSALVVLKGTFVPRFRPGVDYVEAILGIMGSLLTPYVLVWQTSSRREMAETGGAAPHRAEGQAGTFVTTVLAYSVMVAAASVLRLPQPVDMTTLQAAAALRPVAGDWGTVLFAVGIIGAGMVALPVLVVSLCYSIAEAVGWEASLSRRPWEAKSFYMLISLAMLLATMLNFTPLNPVRALYWSQVLAGVLTVPILIFILVAANDRRIVRTPNTRSQNFWIGAAIGGLVSAGLLLLGWKLRA
jgi:Mn2+/Fe2+ NRAMP family transporter